MFADDSLCSSEDTELVAKSVDSGVMLAGRKSQLRHFLGKDLGHTYNCFLLWFPRLWNRAENRPYAVLPASEREQTNNTNDTINLYYKKGKSRS